MAKNKIFQTSLTLWLICYICGLSVEASTSSDAIKLTDYQVYPINGEHQFEPSGLTLSGGKLFTVGDKHAGIYRIDIKGAEAWLSQVVNLDSERDLGVSALDLEGITTYNGDFVLVSENHHRLIHVKESGLRWLPQLGNDLYQSAYNAGLLQIHNAGFEGLAFLNDRNFLLAAERQPRGLVGLTFNPDLTMIERQTNQLMADGLQMVKGRHPDLSGLFVHDKQIFGLYRNAYLINKINLASDGLYKMGQGWSYEHIVRGRSVIYSDMKFGHAEGLAVDEDYFYMVLDNNQISFAEKPNDKRPLLIIARRPGLNGGD